MEDRELTFGEKAVGLTFNPGGDEKVTRVKEYYANIIDLLNNMKTPDPTDGMNRLLSIAISAGDRAVAVSFAEQPVARQSDLPRSS